MKDKIPKNGSIILCRKKGVSDIFENAMKGAFLIYTNGLGVRYFFAFKLIIRFKAKEFKNLKHIKL